MRTKIITVLLASACCQLFAGVALAQAIDPGNVAKVWSITPKTGMSEKFEAAFASHVDWRRKNNDPWHWEVYVQVDGIDVGTYYARSGNHHWADLDGYGEFAEKATKHWNSTVAQYVANVQSSLSEVMPEISNWPEDAPDYRLFMIYSYDIKQGRTSQFNRSAKAIVDVLREINWPYHWAFIDRVSGGAVPGALLVLPSEKWAGMAEPDPNVFEAVAAKTGEGKAIDMFDAYSDSLASSHAYVLEWLPQYTVEGAK